jgi:biopolymer transport protein ExbB/TolQ
MVLTFIFYGVAVYPARHSYFGQVFLERGWITRIEAFLAFWAVAFMIPKAFALPRQRWWLDELARELNQPDKISPATAGQMARSLFQEDKSKGRGFLARRIRSALNGYCVRGDRKEVADLLDSLSDGDANGVESSFTMLRVMIWAIPIVGFIGTVMGLGGAVGGFAGSLDSASDLNALKNSLNGVTSGLSVAFDATLAALSISLLIMFPASWLEKAELDLLAMVDDFCTRHFLLRLEESDGRVDARMENLIKSSVDSSMATHLEALHQALSKSSLKSHQESFQQIIEQLHVAGGHLERLIPAVSSGLTADVDRIGTLVVDQSTLVNQTSQNLANALRRVEDLIVAETKNAGAAWDRATGRQVARINDTLQVAQSDLCATQEALAKLAASFSSALDIALAAQTARFGSILDTTSTHLEKTYTAISDDLHRMGQEWARSLQSASRGLSEAVTAMAESAGKEQRQAVAELELLMGKLGPLLKHTVRRETNDGSAPLSSTSAGSGGIS